MRFVTNSTSSFDVIIVIFFYYYFSTVNKRTGFPYGLYACVFGRKYRKSTNRVRRHVRPVQVRVRRSVNGRRGRGLVIANNACTDDVYNMYAHVRDRDGRSVGNRRMTSSRPADRVVTVGKRINIRRLRD